MLSVYNKQTQEFRKKKSERTSKSRWGDPMDLILLDLVGAIGFQINDTWTTFLGIGVGAVERNKIFKFLSNHRIEDFILVGIIKVLIPLYIYAWMLLFPAYIIILEFDFYLEVGVTIWNIFMIYRHKKVRR